MPRPVALAVLLAACASSAPSRRAADEPVAAPPAAEKPQPKGIDLKAALARELDKALPARAVAGPGGLFQARVEAAADPKVEDGKTSVTVTVPLGTQEPVLCFVYKGSIDAGVSIRNMIDALGESVEIQGVHPVEMTAVGERPAVFVELVYLAAAGRGEKALGHMKLMVSAVDPAAAVCLHDEPGYSATFRRVAKSFLANLTPGPKPSQLAEISVYQIDALQVGLQSRRIWGRKEGGTIQETSSVLFIPKSDSEFVVEDTVSGETGDAEGRLEAYSSLKARDGKVVLTAEAKRASDGAYQVKGTDGGKEFTATLKPPDKKGLPTELLIQRTVRDELLGGKRKDLVLDTYSADNPTRLTRVVYRRGAGARELQYESGDVQFAGTASPEGTFEKMEMPLGDGHRMTMERIFATGGP